MKFVEDKKRYVRKHVKIVTMDEVVRICRDNDFDNDAVDKALNKFKTEDKYKGLEDYEWNDVTSKE